MFIDTFNPLFAGRAVKALLTHGRLLYDRGNFWEVTSVEFEPWRGVDRWVIGLLFVNPRRRSIDDCTPAEWDAASRAAWAALCAGAAGCA